MTTPTNEAVKPAHMTFSIFSAGFRPFFIAAALYAILPLIPLVLLFTGHYTTFISIQSWHSHEMLFGFVGAGFAGFILSALPNWTNTPPVTGQALKSLVILWFLGRIVFWLFLFFDHPVFGYLLFIDLLLQVALTRMIARALIATKNKKNYIFIFISSALLIANLLIILGINKISDTETLGAILATNLILITLAIVGGRVTSNFTRNYLKNKNSNYEMGKYKSLEKPALYLLVFIAIIDLIAPHTHLSYGIALLTALVHLLRFSKWDSFKVLDHPILWVLHLGYLWLIAALFLKGAEGIFTLPYNFYLHSLTMGAMGLFMIGIMSRAALGHTGRPLIVQPVMSIAYYALLIAVILRLVSQIYIDVQILSMVTAAILWCLAFSIYLCLYLPILTKPRVDGNPG